MMVQLFRSYQVAELQPEPVQHVHFIGGQIRRMRSENFVNLVAIR